MSAASLKSIEIEGYGPVTIKPLGRLAVERCREAARRGVPPVTAPGVDPASLDPEALLGWRENANLIGAAVVEPKLSDDDVYEQFGARPEIIGRIAQAVRDASWPNR